MAPVVELAGLSKHYGRTRAVDNVSLSIAPGEVFGLLGPNGSGKSTILKMLLGLLMPSAGRVAVAGFNLLSDGAAARARIGYVPEDATLYPQMRVSEFLTCMAACKGVPKSARPSALESVVAALRLEQVARLAIGKLSRGFRQRVAIAQALLNQPPLLVLDEPTNGLDPHQIIEIRELIQHLAPRHTVLVTSHILSEIERVATRVGILLSGRLLADTDIASTPRVRVRLRAPATLDVGDLLARVTGVVAVQEAPTIEEDAEYLVTLAAWHDAPAVCTALCARGCAVFEFARAAGDLEARFLALTQQAA